MAFKLAAIPYITFKVEKILFLGIPVTGHMQSRGGIEIVFHEVFGFLGVGVLEPAVTILVHTVIIESQFIQVKYIFPCSVQTL
jgi:hypothetical protein